MKARDDGNYESPCTVSTKKKQTHFTFCKDTNDCMFSWTERINQRLNYALIFAHYLTEKQIHKN